MSSDCTQRVSSSYRMCEAQEGTEGGEYFTHILSHVGTEHTVSGLNTEDNFQGER